jgi:hypothetical protein
MSPRLQFEACFERPKIDTHSGAGASTERGSEPRLPAEVMRLKITGHHKSEPAFDGSSGLWSPST